MTTSVSINFIFENGLGQLQMLILDSNTLQIGDMLIISGYKNGTSSQNEIINSSTGYPILSIGSGGLVFTLDFIPGFSVFQVSLSAVIPASRTIINLEFLTY